MMARDPRSVEPFDLPWYKRRYRRLMRYLWGPCPYTHREAINGTILLAGEERRCRLHKWHGGDHKLQVGAMEL